VQRRPAHGELVRVVGLGAEHGGSGGHGLDNNTKLASCGFIHIINS
jgi:hypothetical protein